MALKNAYQPLDELEDESDITTVDAEETLKSKTRRIPPIVLTALELNCNLLKNMLNRFIENYNSLQFVGKKTIDIIMKLSCSACRWKTVCDIETIKSSVKRDVQY